MGRKSFRNKSDDEGSDSGSDLDLSEGPVEREMLAPKVAPLVAKKPIRFSDWDD